MCLLSLALSLPGLWVPYYNIDELTNAVYGRFIAAGTLGLPDFLGNTYLLTHYFYALIGKLFGFSSLVPMHVAHALWKCLTILAFSFAGRELTDGRTGRWAALFYCVASVSFMSKDFHTPSAESFSLLPAVFAAGFLFRGMNRESWRCFLVAGIFTGIATLFKAPMGITLAVMGLSFLVRFKAMIRNGAACLFGFLIALFLPPLLVWPPSHGLGLMMAKLNETNATYIQSYEGLSYLYSLFKLFIRTGLFFGACLAVSAFATQNFRTLFHLKRKHRNYWQKIFFLFVWIGALLFAVSLGGRVFYHYYVFLLAPLPLLAATGIRNFDMRLVAFRHHKTHPDGRFYFLNFVRGNLFWFLAVPAAAFSIEGALNYSTQPPDVAAIVRYVGENAAPEDVIYVWGNVPQIYFDSGRQPATPFFWSDILAGTSPGSPAMEYVRATGEKLSLAQQLGKDFQSQVFQKVRPEQINADTTLSAIGEDELFTLDELLARIDQPYWRRVFSDFFKTPPQLFIDTSPTNIRGFGFSPISKFELLKRFIEDNYDAVGVIDGMVVYRLKLH